MNAPASTASAKVVIASSPALATPTSSAFFAISGGGSASNVMTPVSIGVGRRPSGLRLNRARESTDHEKAGPKARFPVLRRRLGRDGLGRYGRLHCPRLPDREPAEGHEGEDREAEAHQQQRDPDHDAEQRDLLGEERGV